jgi:hypothetical protein
MSTDIAEAALTLANEIKPMLAGKGSEMQAGALAELLATFLASHAPPLREELLREHIECVLALVGPCEKHMFGDAGFPKALQ